MKERTLEFVWESGAVIVGALSGLDNVMAYRMGLVVPVNGNTRYNVVSHAQIRLGLSISLIATRSLEQDHLVETVWYVRDGAAVLRHGAAILL